jgi:hypothetical protein
MEEYTKQQLMELYEQLPENLKKAVFSTEIGELIKKICDENSLSDSYPDLLKKVGYVFLGILSPSEFKESLGDPAVFARINNEVFFNLKNDLDPLYGINLEKTEEQKENPIIKKNKTDKYLESIE